MIQKFCNRNVRQSSIKFVYGFKVYAFPMQWHLINEALLHFNYTVHKFSIQDIVLRSKIGHSHNVMIHFDYINSGHFCKYTRVLRSSPPQIKLYTSKAIQPSGHFFVFLLH
jgi:hypothetical protein